MTTISEKTLGYFDEARQLISRCVSDYDPILTGEIEDEGDEAFGVFTLVFWLDRRIVIIVRLGESPVIYMDEDVYLELNPMNVWVAIAMTAMYRDISI